MARESALTDEKFNNAELSLQHARTVADLSYVVAVQCHAMDLVVAKLEALEKKVKKLQKKADESQG